MINVAHPLLPLFALCLTTVWVLAPLGATAESATTRGQSEVKVNFLAIEATPDLQKEMIGDTEKGFIEVCQTFGNYFINNQGLWGTGGFDGYSCSKNISPKTPKTNLWRLKIARNHEKSRFEISYYDEISEKSHVQVVYEIDAKLGTLRLIHEERYAKLLAAYLNLRLPFCFKITDSILVAGSQVKLGGSSLEEIKPKDLELNIFSLSRKKKLWKTRLLAVGELDLSGDNVLLVVKEVKGSDSQSGIEGLAHFKRDRKEFSSNVDELLKSRIRLDFLGVLTSMRMGYSGFRFASPIGGGSGAFLAASSAGILTELRGGLLSGVRIYYDWVPKVDVKVQTGSESLSMSKLQLGYAYGFPINSTIINWFDVMPKLGINSVNYEVNTRADFSPPSTYTFKINNAAAVGLELGVERRNEQLTARAWLFSNYSLGVSQLENNNKASILKFGLDLFRDVGEFSAVKVAALTFLYRETTTIEKAAKADQAASSLRFNAMLAGAGLVLSW